MPEKVSTLSQVNNLTMSQSMEPWTGPNDGCSSAPITSLVRAVGEHMSDIISGHTNPLELLFDGTLASDYYNQALKAEAKKVGRYVDLLSHARPHLRILIWEHVVLGDVV